MHLIGKNAISSENFWPLPGLIHNVHASYSIYPMDDVICRHIGDTYSCGK